VHLVTRILIIEDHADIRRLIRLTLEIDDYEIFEASNGESGLVAAARVMPDVILLDVMMPGQFDGLEVCRMLKITPGLASVRVVVLSARGTEADRVRGTQAGAEAYLVKPFSPLALARIVAQVATPEAHTS